MSAVSFLSRRAVPGWLRIFLLVWVGQLVSVFGSGLTGFALGLWVYQSTGSVTQYALISLFAVLPRLLLSPLAGVIVDRWDRRRVMLLADLTAGLSTAVVAALLLTGRLQVGHIYVATAVSAACGAFQSPAYLAALSGLIPRDQLGRANGMVQLSQGVAELLTPLAAGFLVLTIQLGGIILIDCLTFLFAVGSLALVRFPGGTLAGSQPGVSPYRSLLADARQGWAFITARPGLTALLGFQAGFNFLWGMVGALAVPMVLGFAGPERLGVLMTTAGSGVLLGSLYLSARGGPRRKVAAILLFELVSGVGFILLGLRPDLVLVGIGAFCAHCTIPFIGGISRELWQRKTPGALQGRVFAAQDMLAHAMQPLALLAVGPLAEVIFEPLLADHSAGLAPALGWLVGTGPARGIGLLFLLMGALKIGVALAAMLYPPLRRLETDLADAEPA